MNDKYIIYFISKTKKKMTKFIEKALKEKGLDDLAPSYGNVLTVLYNNNGRLSMNQIGQIIGKDKSTITALVNKLSNLGYVKKEKCIEDRRVTYITLTEKGNAIEGKVNDISEKVNLIAYKNFSKKEKDIFLELLKKMNNNFDVE
ncbi:MarR family winged helix-turn-helix transcriptional regulator [Clostridium sp.]|uniref:MarR family winged helix-turn-helix transcriptional regulator n=1 Tax=Clostridium sp. TaxID=1506 RepID=UPI001A3A17F3|nr:MarR family winged helix-turn-helix transcriptional regulator [Clostridium sp.]MBK5237298.1 winged helix-turn-helix transcriptional regulator [Clostridium sp.]